MYVTFFSLKYYENYLRLNKFVVKSSIEFQICWADQLNAHLRTRSEFSIISLRINIDSIIKKKII